MSFPSKAGTSSVYTVDVPQNTDVELLPSTLLVGEPPRYQYEASLALYHSGFQTDGVTPTGNSVFIINPGDTPGDSMMEIDTLATRADPYMLLREPYPTTLVFRCTTVGGVRLKVQHTLQFNASANPYTG